MEDEIKEKMTIGKAKKILRGFLAKDCYYDTPLYYAIPYLLDYITNLQEEIKRQSKAQVILDNQIAEMYDYKTRNEKAIELIYKVMKERDITGNGTLNLNELLDVLQGSDE